MIDKEAITKMKDGVMIVNTSRGPIIAIDDLMEAVKEGKVKSAALDVVEGEPITVANHPYLKLEELSVLHMQHIIQLKQNSR